MIGKTTTELSSKKKKVYKNPARVKSVSMDSKFQGRCLFCGVQTGWAATPACGRG